MRKDQWIGTGLVVTLIVLVGVGLSKTSGRRDRDRIPAVRRCRGVMGTDCTLTAVVSYRHKARAEDALREAEAAIGAIEARMSTWIVESEISRFNAAAAGEPVPLSEESLEVLRAARQANRQTDGAFDVTCRPLIELWRQAGQRGVLPDESQRADARQASKWEHIQLADAGAARPGACKRRDTVRVDLGGIAKGYAIDRAAGVLREAGISGGMVEIGGDLICFGRPPDAEVWTVGVKNPFGEGKLAELQLSGGAVCTSGNYERPVVIDGKPYHHIIDPRTGHPAAVVPSVTVVAQTAMTADVWATALSVSGPEGFRRLPEQVEAMVVVGTKNDHQVFCTAGFGELLERPLPNGLKVVGRG